MHHFSSKCNCSKSKETRRTLRQNSTAAEDILWQFIRNNQLGYKFRRQFDIQSFIVDFYCHALRLVIEVDGWTHEFEKTKQRDMVKQQVLEQAGCKVVRFINEEIYGDIGKVLSAITAVCQSQAVELGLSVK